MLDYKFESNMKKYAGEVFGQGTEPPVGHRARFEQRLKENQATMKTKRKAGKVIRLKKWLTTIAVAAAVLSGIVIIRFLPADEMQSFELADVNNYYKMKLVDQVDETKRLIQNIEELSHRNVLLANVEHIENLSIPDVQITDDEYIILLASFYSNKIETLQNIQNIILGKN